jgi:hypothetical protein
MQPYQEAAEEARRQSRIPLTAAKTAASIAGAAIGGAGIFSRIAPFLSEYIPEHLAIKGLSKIDPRLGKFISKSMSDGFDFKEVRQFIGEKVQEHEQSQAAKMAESPKQNRNIIEQYSPELHQFILGEVQKGRSLLEAGALAALDKSNGKGFKSVIQKIEKDHKTPWSAILETVYGAQQAGQQQPTQQTQQIQSGGIDPAVAQILQQGKQVLQNFRGSRG